MTMAFRKLSCMIIIVLITGIGCDNSIQPLNKKKGVYSIYGYLNLHKDANYIRVKNLNKTLSEDTTDNIDATVTLENLHNGKTEKLEDSVVVFDGVKTHNFRTTMDIRPNTQYRVTAKRSDGKSVSATTTTPYLAERKVSPVAPNCTTNVHLSFEPVRNRHAMRLEVGFPYKGKIFWVRKHTSLIAYEQRLSLTFTPLELLAELSSGQEQGGEPSDKILCEELDSNKFSVRYTHYGPDLFGNSVSDTLSIPGGAGRFGAFYKDSFSFPIDTSSLCPPIC